MEVYSLKSCTVNIYRFLFFFFNLLLFVLPLCIHQCTRSSPEKAGQARAGQSVSSNKNESTEGPNAVALWWFVSVTGHSCFSLAKLSSGQRGASLSSCCPSLICFTLLILSVCLFSVAVWHLLHITSVEASWTEGRAAHRQARQILHLWNPCVRKGQGSTCPLARKIKPLLL